MFSVPDKITVAPQSISGLQIAPEEVEDTINEFLAAMIAVADQHEATVDKIICDAVMALFGAPVPINDHAHRAIKTAPGENKG